MLSITLIKQHPTLALTAKKSVREKKKKNYLLPLVSLCRLSRRDRFVEKNPKMFLCRKKKLKLKK